MSNTSQILHIVFRTKRSVAAIPQEHERELYKYIWGIIKGKQCWLYRIGGMPDHLHLLVDLHPHISLSELVRLIKVGSGEWMKHNKSHFPKFEGWGDGYFAYSASKNDIATIINYISHQKEHHAKHSLRDELTAWLQLLNEPTEQLEHFFHDRAPTTKVWKPKQL